ncbi:hypothetical protein LOD99_3584 [Oopsacas minuta]|uniref:Uncharacterized protein n=1 Tax=Oopsacas minuta TaxID=111878 RepID=A0AAV7JXZ8_9METZ|nr:hypothetical protein LOD99_3584 [Oopsacas minuta]
MMVPNVGVILNVTGGYAGAILSFIVPSMMFIKSTKDDNVKGAIFILIMGVVFLLSSPAIMLIEHYQYEGDNQLFVQQEMIVPVDVDYVVEPNVVVTDIIDDLVWEKNMKKSLNDTVMFMKEDRNILQIDDWNKTMDKLTEKGNSIILGETNEIELNFEENLHSHKEEREHQHENSITKN